MSTRLIGLLCALLFALSLGACGPEEEGPSAAGGSGGTGAVGGSGGSGAVGGTGGTGAVGGTGGTGAVGGTGGTGAVGGTGGSGSGGGGGTGGTGGDGGSGGAGGGGAECGDGSLDGDEECDDGNTTAGDGCSATCTLECGNGTADGDEECDDGNTTTGDGCSATCTLECGNGAIDGDEECDDGNPNPADGCDACAVQQGWSCPPGVSCRPIVCGDGFSDAGEACDDGGTAGGDGCSATCVIEGSTCAEPADLDSFAVAGTGWVWSANSTGYPAEVDVGCGATSTNPDAKATFTVPTAGSYVFEIESTSGMYFAVRRGACLDAGADELLCGHTGSAPAAVELTQGETVYVIADGPPAQFTVTVRPLSCGDSILAAPFEQCDDGNQTDGDGCSATCQAETVLEVEPNDSFPTATPLGTSLVARGALNNASIDVDAYSFVPTVGTPVTIRTALSPSGAPCPAGTLATYLEVFGPNEASLAVQPNPISATDRCSQITFTPNVSGTYYVAVAANPFTAQYPLYFLLIQ